MAEQWIDAATALEIVVAPTGSLRGGIESLCDRAHMGLVKSRAKLFVVGDRRTENADVPAKFWWAGGHEALEQNWSTGDFSTWINRQVHLRAFGVTFALSAVLEMLSAEQRVLVARRLSVVGNAAWMPAREASLFACKAPGITNGRTAVLDYARLGFVIGHAVLAQGFANRHNPAPIWEEREWDVPASFWGHCMEMDEIQCDWQLGRFSAQITPVAETRRVALNGTHFLTESLQVLIPPAETALPVTSAPTDAQAKAGPGGRPPQPWWDDLWCAVWGLIHQGDLTPKTQADVEKAMLTWATRNGHDVSEATVRPKARKLFQTYKGEATNFLAG